MRVLALGRVARSYHDYAGYELSFSIRNPASSAELSFYILFYYGRSRGINLRNSWMLLFSIQPVLLRQLPKRRAIWPERPVPCGLVFSSYFDR